MTALGQDICASALNKYTTALVEEVLKTKTELTIPEVHLRISEMLSVLPSMEVSFFVLLNLNFRL